MKYLSLIAILFLFPAAARAQVKPNAAIQQHLKSLGSERIDLAHDAGSNVTTIKAVADNFANDEAKRAGVKAMNFAVGVIYPGAGLDRSPDLYMLSFWVLSGKPRFGDDHTFAAVLGGETLDLGSARYVFRARDGMEYLNFNLTREQLKRLASQPRARFRLGKNEFTFTASQTKLLSDLHAATDVK